MFVGIFETASVSVKKKNVCMYIYIHLFFIFFEIHLSHGCVEAKAQTQASMAPSLSTGSCKLSNILPGQKTDLMKSGSEL